MTSPKFIIIELFEALETTGAIKKTIKRDKIVSFKIQLVYVLSIFQHVAKEQHNVNKHYEAIYFSLLSLSYSRTYLSDTSIDPYKCHELGFSPQEIIIHEKIDVLKKERGMLYFNEKATRILPLSSTGIPSKSKFSPYVEEAQELYEKIRR